MFARSIPALLFAIAVLAPRGLGQAVQEAFLKAPNAGVGDNFGWSVAVSGDLLVVGAPNEDSNATGVNGDQDNNDAIDAGAAYVFTWTGTGWVPNGYLKASNTDSQDAFGSSVAISGGTVVVAAPEEDGRSIGVNGDETNNGASSSGALYVFVRQGGSWTQQAYIKLPTIFPFGRFGDSLSLDGDTLVAGSLVLEKAYVYERAGSSWSHAATLEPFDPPPHTKFGRSVSVDGDTIAVGSENDAAYTFVREASGWIPESLIPAPFNGDQFGFNVALAGDVLAIAAPQEDSNATGVGGNESNNSVSQAGAAYAYRRFGHAWLKEAYLKPPAPVVGQKFGFRLAAAENTIVVGNYGAPFFAELFSHDGSNWTYADQLGSSVSPGGNFFGLSLGAIRDRVLCGARVESSGTNMVDGPETNGGLTGSGAAYLFDQDGQFESGLSICSGDGGDQMGCTSCPCTNASPPGAVGGCLNSSGTPARLISAGDPSVSLPSGSTSDLRLSLTAAPPLSFCILNSGDNVAPQNAANPCFGMQSGVQSLSYDGLRCAVGNERRQGGRPADVNGDVGATNSPWGGEAAPTAGIANAGGGHAAGQTRYFQVVYRDDPLLVCTRGLNTSQAVEVTFLP